MFFEFICWLYDFFVPRFVTEEVALAINAYGDFETVCTTAVLKEFERYDAVCDVCGFVWLGKGWFGRQVGEVRTWPY